VLFTMLYFKEAKPLPKAGKRKAGDEEDADTEADAVAEDPAAAGTSSATQPTRSSRRTTLALLPSHPHYLMHHLVRHRKPTIFRLPGEAPVRPSPDATPDEQEAWAAYCAANFTAHSIDSMPAAPFADHVRAWEDSLALAALPPPPQQQQQ
jgi:hypothetical protein